jgi:GT2 family glycosyltransferase
MPSRDNPTLLQVAARSVLNETCPLELVIVDNGSAHRDQLVFLETLARDPRVRIVREPGPFNFSRLINLGRAAASGDVLLLLNDDVRADTLGWLSRIAAVASTSHAGCVGALLVYPSGRIQHAGVVLGIFGLAGHAFRHLPADRASLGHRFDAVHEVSAVTGACLAVRAELFDAVGGFDESLPVTLNDVDFCLRVSAQGYSNLMAPQVRLVHYESASRGLDIDPAQAERLAEEIGRFMAKWGATVLTDPYYSPHLTLSREDFTPRDI